MNGEMKRLSFSLGPRRTWLNSFLHKNFPTNGDDLKLNLNVFSRSTELYRAGYLKRKLFWNYRT
jgi:hypothetical protein